MEQQDKLTWAILGLGILANAIEGKGYEIKFVKNKGGVQNGSNSPRQ